jgi:hypothetical protein
LFVQILVICEIGATPYMMRVLAFIAGGCYLMLFIAGGCYLMLFIAGGCYLMLFYENDQFWLLLFWWACTCKGAYYPQAYNPLS